MAHTPGPWRLRMPPDSYYPTVHAGEETHVAELILFHAASEAEIKANCNLIAAAPDLLAALKMVERDRLNCNGRVLEMHAPTIRAAIAKATGQEDE